MQHFFIDLSPTSISVGLPIWHSVSADTDTNRGFDISAKPIIGRYTDISVHTLDSVLVVFLGKLLCTYPSICEF